jgi:hypothetical protein
VSRKLVADAYKFIFLSYIILIIASCHSVAMRKEWVNCLIVRLIYCEITLWNLSFIQAGPIKSCLQQFNRTTNPFNGTINKVGNINTYCLLILGNTLGILTRGR